MDWINHIVRFVVAHTLGSLGALLLFLVPFFMPYLPVAPYMDWGAAWPHLTPALIGLGVAIWLAAAPLAEGVNYILRRISLINRQDYVLTGFTVGLVVSVPFVKAMGIHVVDTTATPVVTSTWLLINQLVYVMAWALSGALYGLCYYYFHSERIRKSLY